jgi:hypothetical protein
MRVFTRKECWVPTARGWLALAAVFLGGAARAVRAWLESSHPAVRAVNLYSMGPHSRRSRLLYQKAFGSRVKVGLIAHPDNSYDPKRWWASSNGFHAVLSEGIAYLYARILFYPPKTE